MNHKDVLKGTEKKKKQEEKRLLLLSNCFNVILTCKNTKLASSMFIHFV